MVRLLTLALVVGSAFTSANALGINCKGDSSCKYVQKEADAANQLASLLGGVDDHQWFNNGQHIACVAAPGNDEATAAIPWAVCAYFGNSDGGDGARVKQLASLIPGHGCKTCGAVPYWFPEGSRNVNDGYLRYDSFSINGEDACPGFPGLC